jgi:hypothetical protein
MSQLRLPRILPALALAAAAAVPAPAIAGPVDLSLWTAESYPAVAGFGAGVWTVQGGGVTVNQSVNGQPTIYYSDFNAFGTEMVGRITVGPNAGDDDYIGFVLGFGPGDTTNALADYLLMDWKQVDQFFDFGNPSTTPGGTAERGLAVSRVTGVPTADEFWAHTDFGAHAGGTVTELARGATLGDTGWAHGQEYEFKFTFTPTLLEVWVDDVLQMSVAGSFSDGRIGFYNFSQADVTYSGFTVDDVPFDPVPEPGSMILFGTGAAALAARARRRRRSS